MPNTLKQRFQQFAKQIGIQEPTPIWSDIELFYNSPDRHYHNLEHIQDLLTKLDQWPEPCPERNTIELAIWFHDIIYDTKKHDNEQASANLLIHHLRDHPLQAQASSLILATLHSEASTTPSAQILCDIDLSTLGAQTEVYQTYAQNIRKEYHLVPQKEFTEKRTQVLENFLNRNKIYHTQHAQDLWQNQAKENLKKEIKSLNQ